MFKDRHIKHGKDLKPQWQLFVNEGNQAMYKEIYLHYYHYLTFIALKKGYSTSKTNDSLNELFMYVWENREILILIANHHNYLLTVFLRKLYKKEISAEECLSYDQLPDLGFSPSVEEEYIAKGTQERVSDILNRFIRQLPTKQRSLIYQKFYLGLSYGEIAVANDISINTVYNTIYKAVDNLKTTIGKEHLNALYLTLAAISILFFIFFIK